MVNFQQQLDSVGGRPSGFDYLRITLSTLVICMHSALTSYGIGADIALWESPLRPFLRMIVPAFFALSGFLVAGSLLRCKTLVMFAGLRVIRIFPALVVEVILSAFLIGPLLTAVPMWQYFTDPTFFRYLLNMLGDIHYILPGVFTDNPFPDTVNAQLWTVPWELYCYITLIILGLIGLKRHRFLAPTAVAGLELFHMFGRLYKNHWQYVEITGALPTVLLLCSFLAGLSLYLYRDWVPFSRRFGALAFVLLIPMLWFIPFGDYIAVPLLAYAVCVLGLCDPIRVRVIKGADYSYGMYLYGFVIQQTMVHVMPFTRVWWVNILVAVPFAAAFAAMSWHLVEKPFLANKASLQKIEAWWIAVRGRYWPRAARA